MNTKINNVHEKNSVEIQMENQLKQENQADAISENESIMIKVKSAAIFMKEFQSHQQNLLHRRDIERSVNQQVQVIQVYNDNGINAYLNPLEDFIQNSSKEERINRALRHFYDAVHYRTVRYDIDFNKNKVLKVLQLWQRHWFWRYFLLIISCAYMSLILYEPSNSNDNNYLIMINSNSLKAKLFSLEISFILIFFLNLMLKIIQKICIKDKSLVKKFFLNKKFLLQFIIFLAFLIDFNIYYSKFPNLTYRFSRYFRPINIYFFSKTIKQYANGIINSITYMIEIILFFLILILMWALIGYKMIPNSPQLEQQQNHSLFNTTFEQVAHYYNFDNFAYTMNALYNLLSADNYPSISLESVKISHWYLLYFLSFALFNYLFLILIPVAILYKAFTKYQLKIILKDRLKQKVALFNCFVCFENECLLMDFQTFKSFSQKLYKYNYNEEKIQQLFKMLDVNNSNSLSFQEFVKIIDVIDHNSQFYIQAFPTVKCWKKLRDFLNKKFNLQQIAKSSKLILFIVLISIINSAMIIYTIVKVGKDAESEHDSLITVFHYLDYVFLMCYILEIAIKFIGFGAQSYFKNNWNRFDFMMVCLTIIIEIAFSFIPFLKNLKILKIGKIFKLQHAKQIAEIFIAIRSIKVLQFINLGARTVIRLRNFVYKLFFCIPIVFKMTVLIFIIFYIYALVGISFFNENTRIPVYPDSKIVLITNFKSFPHALLSLVQVFTQSEWYKLKIHYSYIYGSQFLPALYFISFHFITVMLLYSLLKGLIWEVFGVVETQFENKEKMDKILENQIQKIKFDQLQTQQTKSKSDEKIPIISNSISNNQLNIKEQEELSECSKISQQKLSFHTRNSYMTNEEIQSNLNSQQQASSKLFENNLILKDLVIESQICDEHQGFKSNQNVFQSQYHQNHDLFKEQHKSKNKVQYSFHFIKKFIQRSIQKSQEEIQSLKLDTNLNMSQMKRSKDSIRSLSQSKIQYNKEVNNFFYQPTFSNINMSHCYSQQINAKAKNDLIDKDIDKSFGSQASLLLSEGIDDEDSSFYKVKRIKKNKKFVKHQKKRNIFLEKLGIYSENWINSEEENNKECKFYQHKFKLLSKLINNAKKKKDQKILHKKGDEYIFQLYESDYDQTKPLNAVVDKIIRDTKYDYNDATSPNFTKQNNNKIAKQNATNFKIKQKNLMKNVILSKNQNILNKYDEFEENYMQNYFGRRYHQLKQVDDKPQVALCHQMITEFMIMLRHSHIQINKFINYLLYFEQKILSKLLNKGSFCKFIFGTENNHWFGIQKLKRKFKLIELQEGPWIFCEQLFPNNKEIYHNKDIFYDEEKFENQLFLQEFYLNLRKLSLSFGAKSFFHQYDPSSHIWNMFAIPLLYDGDKQLIISKTRKNIDQIQELNSPYNQEMTYLHHKVMNKLLRNPITKILFITVNYIDKAKIKDIIISDVRIKKNLENQQKQNVSLAKFLSNNELNSLNEINLQQCNESVIKKIGSDKNLDIQSALNQNELISIVSESRKHIHQKKSDINIIGAGIQFAEQTQFLEEQISQTKVPKNHVCLPLVNLIEMYKSISDIFKLYDLNFFIQITEFYYYYHSKNYQKRWQNEQP